MPKTQRHTAILITVVLLMVVFFCLLAYTRAFIVRDYIVVGEASCDPETESCFVYECDPTIEECTGDPEQDIWYYKQIRKLASTVSVCDPLTPEECPELACSFREYGCEEIYCDPEGGDVCAEPMDAAEDVGGSSDEALEEIEESENNVPQEADSMAPTETEENNAEDEGLVQ